MSQYPDCNSKVYLTEMTVPLDISRLEEAIQDKDGFKKLVLPKGHTKLVESLVQMHTRLPSAPDTSELSTLSREFQMDLIRGKGKGLIILLHGAPGVGKTSTAGKFPRQPEISYGRARVLHPQNL